MESTQKQLHLLLLLLLLTTLFSLSSAISFPQEALPTKSGYLTVNSTSGSSIFYTFYEAQNPRTSIPDTPIVIWLQGGPGCSSMLGNFYELGPFRVSVSLRHNVEHLTLVRNSGSWNRIFGVLFLDNPIGTGFSVAGSQDEVPRNQHDVAKHLFIAVKEFVGMDKLFENRSIYVTGESYAGKYVPAFGYYTLKKNARLAKSKRLNLAGVGIGNGLTDPETQVGTHALNTYYSGLINEKQKVELEKLQKEAIRLTRNGNWSEATRARSRVLSTLSNMSGLATLYDFRRLKPYEDELVARFLSNVEIKRALKARESISFEVCSDLVGKILHEDVMKSVRYMVEFLVKNTKVLLYQGQCDLRDGVVSTEAWMKKMKWEGIGKFLEAERNVWRVNDELAGYVQKWENLTHVVVMNAGHLVPTDQAVNSQAMIEDWVLEKGLFATGQIKQKPSHIAISIHSSFPQEALPTKSGYLTVNSTSGSSIFFAFYEAQKPRMPISETPILIWLQGGPGCSSMLGNFYELGPFRVSSSLRQNVEHLVLERNPGSWNQIFGVIFLDNPIDTGFSIASSPEEIPRNQHDVAKHLFIAIREFVGLDKLFENRPIYVTGESYAGKYVPAFGYYTLKKNEGLPKSRRLNLAGVGIGNGLTDPEIQVGTHALNAYYSGLINEKQKMELEKHQKEAVRLMKNGF